MEAKVSRISKKSLIFILSFLIIAAAMAWAVVSVRHLPHYDYDLEDWKSEHAVYRNNGLSVDEKIKDQNKKIDFLWGPHLPLKKGSYTANIQYSAEFDQSCLAAASNGEAELFDSSPAHMSSRLHSLAYQFEVKDDVTEFQLVFNYSGVGDFTVNSVSIVANNNHQKRVVIEIIAAVFLLNGLFLLSERSKEIKMTVLSLIGITALVSLPLAVHGIHNGHDLGVHYLRIEAVVQAIRSGQFPARISAVTLYGLGYPFSIYYNDLFLYFPALLRILGFSVDLAYKIYVTVINLLTVCISWFSFRYIFRSQKISLILSLVYASASYRLMNIYIRGAVGEYTAQAFLPLLALALYRIYYENKPEKWFRNGILLAFAMSGIIGAHVLTTIMACFVLALFCLWNWRKTFSKPVLKSMMTGILFAVLLNIYFFVPFIDYYFTVPTFIRKVVDKELVLIQYLGIYPGQYFAFFQDLFGYAVLNVNERIQFTPGLPLMLLFAAGLYFRFFGSRRKEYDMLLVFSFLTLWISSSEFPWDWLTLHFPPWNILVQVQFPYRFLVFAILFLTLLGGCILKHETLLFLKQGVVIASVLMTIWFMSNYFDGAQVIYLYDTSSVFPTWTGHEYFLNGSVREKIKADIFSENMAQTEMLSRNSNTLKMYCKTDDSTSQHLVDAPVYAYKGYHVLDDDGREYEYFPGDQNRINFELPDGFDGSITIIFRDPVYWRIALWISIFTVFGLAAWCLGQVSHGDRSLDSKFRK